MAPPVQPTGLKSLSASINEIKVQHDLVVKQLESYAKQLEKNSARTNVNEEKIVNITKKVSDNEVTINSILNS